MYGHDGLFLFFNQAYKLDDKVLLTHETLRPPMRCTLTIDVVVKFMCDI